MAVKKIAMFQPFVAESAAKRVEEVLRGRWVGQGPLVDAFETALETALGIPHAVAVNASSSAIRLALQLSGVGPGDEVITTPLTCTLTNHPVLEQYARVVFADIQQESGNIDPLDIEKRITRHTKAILVTHWSGQAPDLDEINLIAERHGLSVIEDASEALGGTYRGRPIGDISRFTAFSFQAIQIVNTGEGGLLAVRDERARRLARTLRWYGIDRDSRTPDGLGYYDFDISSVGFGYHMTNIAAAIGLENLPTLPAQLAHRRRIAGMYREAFRSAGSVSLLTEARDREPTFHFFTMLVEGREAFCRAMRDRGIETSIVHARNDLYTVFGGERRDLPQLNVFSRSYIGLPTHMHLTDEDVEHIIHSVNAGW